MRMDDDADDTEDVDEVLPGQDDPPTSHRVRVTLWVVVVLAAVGALVGVVVHNHTRPVALPTPTVSVPATPSIGLTDPVVTPVSPCDEISSDGLSCSVTTTVPASVRQAIRAAFPDADVTTVNTVIGVRSDKLFERTIHADADAGRQSIDIRIIQTDETHPNIITTDAKTGRIIGAETDLSGHHVTVMVDGAPAAGSKAPNVLGLANDPRLLVLH